MLFLPLITAAIALPKRPQFQGDQVIRFQNLDAQDFVTLHGLIDDHSLQLDVWSHGDSTKMDVRVPLKALSVVAAKTADIDQSVWIANVQELVDQEQPKSVFNRYDGTSATLFKAYQDASVYVDFLLSQPGATEINLGKSYNGLDIRGAKFGNGTKQVFINGAVHAREWISSAVVTYVANFLLSSDPEAAQMRSLFTFHFVPVLNVDGYAFTRDPNGNRMWRKNREPNPGSTCVGTDPNRK
jgi:murein tripeptide amidase MpaA